MTFAKLQKTINELEFGIDSVCGGKPFIEFKGLCKVYGITLDDKVATAILKTRLAALGYKPVKIGKSLKDDSVQITFSKLNTTKSFYLYSKHIECIIFI